MSPSSQSSPKQQRKKKRKKSRSSASSSSSSPLAAAAAAAPPPETKKVTIKVQKPNNAVDPVLVSFPGGVPSTDKTDNIQFEWRKLHPKSLSGRIIEGKDKTTTNNINNDGTTAATTSCLYRATSQGIGYDDRRTKMCIGLYDKQTARVTVHQVASKGTVFALQQHLVSYEETFPDQQQDNIKDLLFSDFGSARKRKVLKSQQANRVNVDTVVGSGRAMIDSIQGVGGGGGGSGDTKDNKMMSESNRRAIAQALVKVEEQKQQQQQQDGSTTNKNNNMSATAALTGVEAAHEQARRSILPPYDINAKSICDVYEFRGIVGDDGWSTICRTIDACLYHQKNTNEEVEEEDGGNFVEALTRGGSRPGGDDDHGTEKRDNNNWSQSVMDCLRYADTKGIVDAARHESNSVAKRRSSAKHQLRCILLLHFLLRFYNRFNSGGGGGRRGRVVPGMEDDQPKWFGIPRAAALYLLRHFATEHHDVRRSHLLLDDEDGASNKKRKYNDTNPDLPRYIMSPANKDRCLVHILLVYLLARGGPKSMMVDDMTLILQDLGGGGGGVDTKQAGGLLRMVGCTVATNANIKRTKAFLTVPLTFPQPKRRGGKKSR